MASSPISDGSTIHYHLDAPTISNELQLFLSGLCGTPVRRFPRGAATIQFSPGAADGARTVTWAATTPVITSPTVTTTVDVGPILNSFTLNVSEGGTTVLTNSDFNVSDPGFTDPTYSVNNVTGGQFQASTAVTGYPRRPAASPPRRSPPVTSNLSRMVATRPEFPDPRQRRRPMPARHRADHEFHRTPPVVSTSNMALAAQSTCGGAAQHQGAAVAYRRRPPLSQSYNNGPRDADPERQRHHRSRSTPHPAVCCSGSTLRVRVEPRRLPRWRGVGTSNGLYTDRAGESNPGSRLTSDTLRRRRGQIDLRPLRRLGPRHGRQQSAPRQRGHAAQHLLFSYQRRRRFPERPRDDAGRRHGYLCLRVRQPASFSGYVIGEYSSNGMC